MMVFVAQWLVEVLFCAGAFCTALVDCAITHVGMLDFHECLSMSAFTHVACSKHFPLLAFRVEMAFQRFPALVVVFI